VIALSFWNRFFGRFHQVMLLLSFACCFACVLASPFYTNYWAWDVLLDMNALLSVFLTVFLDMKGFWFQYMVLSALLFTPAFVYVVYTRIISEFVYVSVGLLLISSLSSAYSTERLEKSRYSLVIKLQKETARSDVILREMLPQSVLLELIQGWFSRRS
jgi:hypothetical protein